MLQAWDFVPGTNFIDFMDRGLSQAAAVVAVLSRHYLNSTYGRLEWQAALRACTVLGTRTADTTYAPAAPVQVEWCARQGMGAH